MEIFKYLSIPVKMLVIRDLEAELRRRDLRDADEAEADRVDAKLKSWIKEANNVMTDIAKNGP